jgi:hypothetical protein
VQFLSIRLLILQLAREDLLGHPVLVPAVWASVSAADRHLLVLQWHLVVVVVVQITRALSALTPMLLRLRCLVLEQTAVAAEEPVSPLKMYPSIGLLLQLHLTHRQADMEMLVVLGLSPVPVVTEAVLVAVVQVLKVVRS